MAAQPLTMLTPYLAMAGVGWLYYRRLRRHFGYQRWQPRRTWFRVALLGVVIVCLALVGWTLPRLVPGMALGALAGVALGLLALRHTRVELRDGVPGYTPNPWIGGALSVLLLARLAWRWSQGELSGGLQQPAQASPLTLALATALVAYSLTQCIGLLRRMRALAAVR
ncbi:hypothetical protein [Pseudomonas sp. Hp2]|uniref:hypothetical protein n=1 Tax=Pseudomonas sp. Hp2 TaxID=701189 RepID=UPI0011268763|nr:hypothetical protein [Pseudomonas sp. Hp2]